MSTPSAPTLELLLSEADWLRRLARHLVHDSAAAEDLVQETWIAALAAAPGDEVAADPARRRGWLGRVARRKAGKGFDQRSLQRSRENDAASLRSDEVCASPEVMAERMELQNEVAQAVLKVKEPYQSALYLRYYEGRSAAAAAQILGVPESTVRSRLHRGREAVRDILTEDGRSWSAWSAALAPWLRIHAEQPAAATALASGTVGGWFSLRWLAAAAGATALLGGAWWLIDPVSAPSPVNAVAAANGAELLDPIAPASPGNSVPASTAARSAEPVVSPPSAAADATTLVTGRVLDEEGAPVAGAYIHLESGPTVRKSRSAAETGAWAIPGLAPGAWSVVITEGTHSMVFEELVLDGESTRQLDVTLRADLALPVRFKSPSGDLLVGDVYDTVRSHMFVPRPIPLEERLGTRSVTPPVLYPSVVATRTRPNGQLLGVKAGRPWRFGVGTWNERGNVRHSRGLGAPDDCQGVIAIEAPLPVWVSLVYGDRVLESKLVNAPQELIEFEVSQVMLREQHGTVRFDVGGPGPLGESVTAFLESYPAIRVGRLKPAFVGMEEGLATLYGVPPGRHKIGVGHLRSNFEQQAVYAQVEPGQDTVIGPIQILPSAPFNVTLLDAAGAPVNARVRASRVSQAATCLHEDWAGSGITNSAGAATISSVGAGEVWVTVQVRRPRQVFSATLNTSVMHELNLVVPDATEVRVVRNRMSHDARFDLLDERGIPLNLGGQLNGTWLLSPGRYTLAPRDHAAGTESHTFEVGSDPVVLDLNALD